MHLEDLVRRACEKFARKLPTWVITVAEEDAYLARHYILHKDWIPDPWKRWIPSIFVHEFKRGDSDREYHNHPWHFSVAIILAGGYTEARVHLDGSQYKITHRKFLPGMVNVIRASDFHRVALLDGKTTWTLFVAGQRTGESWGFLDTEEKEFIPWLEHVRRRARQAASYTNGAFDYEKRT